jgi:hypothetical protein
MLSSQDHLLFGHHLLSDLPSIFALRANTRLCGVVSNPAVFCDSEKPASIGI